MACQDYLKLSSLLFLVLLFSTKTNGTILSSPSIKNTNLKLPSDSAPPSHFRSVTRHTLSKELVNTRSSKHTPNSYPEFPAYLSDISVSQDLISPCYLITTTNATNATIFWVTNNFYNPLGFSNQTAHNLTLGFGKNQSVVVSMVYTWGSSKGVGFWAPDFQYNNTHYTTPASNCMIDHEDDGKGNGCVEPFVC